MRYTPFYMMDILNDIVDACECCESLLNKPQDIPCIDDIEIVEIEPKKEVAKLTPVETSTSGEKEYKTVQKEMCIAVDYILRSNDTTIVFWKDGDKTVVKKMATDKYDPYSAFCYALAKKIYGSTWKAQKLVEEKTKVQDVKPRSKKKEKK